MTIYRIPLHRRIHEQVKQGLPVTPDLNNQDLRAHRLSLSLASVLFDKDFVDVNENPCCCQSCDTIETYKASRNKKGSQRSKRRVDRERVYVPFDYSWRDYHPLDRFNLNNESPLYATAVGCARLTKDTVYHISNRLFYGTWWAART